MLMACLRLYVDIRGGNRHTLAAQSSPGEETEIVRAVEKGREGHHDP